MPIYRIADLNIKITPKTKFSINRLAPYMVDADEYDFQVVVNQQHIDYELSVAQEGEKSPPSLLLYSDKYVQLFYKAITECLFTVPL